MRDDFEEEINQYKFRIGEQQKQIEILQDKYKLLENYNEDMKEQMRK